MTAKDETAKVLSKFDIKDNPFKIDGRHNAFSSLKTFSGYFV